MKNLIGNKKILLLMTVAAALVFLGNSIAHGHAKNESYIWLNPQADRFNGHIEFRLEDLRKYFKMDIPSEYDAARTNIIEREAELEEYVRANFELKTIDNEIINYKIVKVDLLKNNYFGHFAQFFFETETMKVPSDVLVKCTFLFEHDKYSRCLLCTQYNHFTGKKHHEGFYHAVFNPWNSEQPIDFSDLQAVKLGKLYYIWEGIRHIWIGLDHIFFLVTLLLASVLVKRIDGGAPIDESEHDSTDEDQLISKPKLIKPQYQWLPVEGFKEAFWNIFKIVTIFTIAHSITLALASLDIITLPSRLVESIIALSIILVAINNIIPMFRDQTWVILFLLGLFHGMGFASVMQNLPFRMENLTSLLICFNIGVELGQLTIVATVFPIIYYLRKSHWYKPLILVGGSSIMIVIAGYWFIERAFGWA